MTRHPALFAALCATLCVFGVFASAQDRGGRFPGREMGFRPGPAEFARPTPRDFQAHPSGGQAFDRAPRDGQMFERREPGGAGYGYPPARYAPPRYAAPPLRRPFPSVPGWRAAPYDSARLREPRMASLGWVIESLQRRAPGRQLDAEVGYLDGRPVYRVLWLTVRGRRMDYVVDAESGAILSGR